MGTRTLYKSLLSAALLAFGAAGANAQLTGSVSVEGEYAPIIIDTERLNTFPQGMRFELPAPNLNYEYSGMAVDYKPQLFSMGVTGRLTGNPLKPRHGFVDLSLGSWLDSRLHAGAVIFSDNANSLTADLKFQSSSLYKMYGLPEDFTRANKKALYDGTLGLSYAHIFDTEGLLTADLSYRCAYFNYYGTALPLADLPPGVESAKAPSQTLNQLRTAVGYASSTSFIRGWHLNGEIDYLSYRRLYSPLLDGLQSKGDRETELKLEGGYTFAIRENQGVAIDALADFLFYSKEKPLALMLPEVERDNYGLFSLRPSYRFEHKGFRLKAGIDLDITYDAMGRTAAQGFNAIHLAPDLSAEYSTDNISLFLKAEGGVSPVTLQMREKFNRYQMPWLLSTQPVYSPLDARVGITAGPFSGFTGRVALRYAAARNVPLGGWYQAFIGAYLPGAGNFDRNLYLSPYRQAINLHGFSIELAARYAFGSMVEVNFEGSYTPQKGHRGIFNGFDRPRWELKAGAGVRPFDKLKIEAGFDYRGVRKCYSLLPAPEGGTTLSAYRLGDVTDLHAKITYSLLKNLDIYAEGNNLLNRHWEVIPGLVSEGLVVAGGFYIEF